MIEEIETIDNNCIVKAFENNPIAILQEDVDNKKVYYFKGSDIGKALHLTNIHSTIQNYEDEDKDERVIRKAYDPQMNIQNTTFLSSQGVYRLLLINLNAFYFKNLFKDKLFIYKYINTLQHWKMNEEIKEDNNCIVKAFENNPISIIAEEINNKKIYLF